LLKMDGWEAVITVWCVQGLVTLILNGKRRVTIIHTPQHNGFSVTITIIQDSRLAFFSPGKKPKKLRPIYI
jgi:hypothetical protein